MTNMGATNMGEGPAEGTLRGSCLCGAVEYEIAQPFMRFVHCYCRRCRKATGTARATNIVVSPGQLRWLRGESVTGRWDMPEAASFATMVCTRCFCPVPHPTRSGRAVIVPAGSLDDLPPHGPTEHTQWASRADWVSIDEADLPCRDD